MKIAFDFGGVLNENEHIRTLANILLSTCEVHIISAQHNAEMCDVISKEIANWGIPFSGVHFVVDGTPLTPDGAIEYIIGLKKVEIMRRTGITILFDDNPYIIESVINSGLCGVLVARGRIPLRGYHVI